MRVRILSGVIVAVTLSACSIKQTVDPISNALPREICIVEDTAVREGFLKEYRSALSEMGIVTKVLPEHSPVSACPVTSTYTARWSWDFTIYMSYAEINVFEDGVRAGRAVYDSRMGGLRLDKWKDAEPKIRELVNQLFGTGKS